jgi:hypothetical protein
MYLHGITPVPSSGSAVGVRHGSIPSRPTDSVHIVIQGAAERADVRLPGYLWARRFSLLWDSAVDGPPEVDATPVTPGTVISIPGNSVRVYRA